MVVTLPVSDLSKKTKSFSFHKAQVSSFYQIVFLFTMNGDLI